MVKVLRCSYSGEDVEVENIDPNNLTKVEGKPIIAPLLTRKKYRFVILEIVNLPVTEKE